MKNSATAFSVGVLFAMGLGISGMTQPQKVIGFLDIFGSWDPSLLFVMGGAVGVHWFTYRWILKRSVPLLAAQWHIPNKKDLTPSLVFGSLLFGVGWGMAGYCPGPALTSLASLQLKPVYFVLSMIAGMYLFRLFDKFFPAKR
jgi:uncharacterized membrane protein YedE/YeeE